MTIPMKHDPRFELWLGSIFDDTAPNPPRPMEWAERLAFISALFGEFELLMSKYPANSVAAGLERLIDPGGNEDMHALTNAELPAGTRVEAINNLSGMLRYFETHCLPELSHASAEPLSPLNEICYSWWDIFPAFPNTEDPARRPIDAAFLRHMSDALKSNSPAVQEYGLHGLGHWHHDYPKEVETLVGQYLDRNRQLDASLASYAASARQGMIR